MLLGDQMWQADQKMHSIVEFTAAPVVC